jgi:predicted MFS family arabinose efflux permease
MPPGPAFPLFRTGDSAMSTIAETLPRVATAHASSGALLRNVTMGLISFLTFVDLFAAQAILPSLVARYGVTPGEMGIAVNASTIGMAASGLAVAFFSRRLNRRQGIWISLALLAIPTTLLSVAPSLAIFAGLRIVQGIFMAAAFALTIAYLAERASQFDTASALAACITGNVASNLVGRLVAASIVDLAGIAPTFLFFAGLNLAGAALAFVTLQRCTPALAEDSRPGSPFQAWRIHLADPALRAAFLLGFCILFVFIGTFTYVNFVLARAPIGLSPMYLGLVYLVFLPSIATTPVAGKIAVRIGTRPTFLLSLGLAAAGLPLLLLPSLAPVLAGLVAIGVGTFLAQAAATGFVGRAARADRGAASGIYLASYYLGGLGGAAVLGRVFDTAGWPACVAALGIATAIAMLLSLRLRLPTAARPSMQPAE